MIRESSKGESKTVAKDAERVRRRELEESWNQIKRRKLPPLFSLASSDWLKTRTTIVPATERSYKLAISQLTKDFGKQLLCDVSAEDLAAYQARRKREGKSNRTVNLELGVLRSILRRHRMWEAISPDVHFFKETESIGRALEHEEEVRLLDAASKSRCRSLYTVVVLGLNTGMRSGEICRLTWAQVDFLKKIVTGKSKTKESSGRPIPLNPHAAAVLAYWRGLFPNAQPEHYVFPSEKYGLAGADRKICVYQVDPTAPMNRWKGAWESARKTAKVACRFHDLRHTFISRVAEGQASDATIMSLAGHISRK